MSKYNEIKKLLENFHKESLPEPYPSVNSSWLGNSSSDVAVLLHHPKQQRPNRFILVGLSFDGVIIESINEYGEMYNLTRDEEYEAWIKFTNNEVEIIDRNEVEK